jgi:hypothetical protein
MPRTDDRDDENDEPIRRPRRHRDEEEYDDRPRRRRSEPEFEATDVLIPTNVSGYSLAACYLGLISCLPILGPVTGIIAVVSGIIALRRRKQSKNRGSYGAVTGDMRAVIGIVLGSLGFLFSAPVTVLVIVGILHD